MLSINFHAVELQFIAQLDLSFDAPPRFVMEPPGYQLHLWSPTLGLVSHTVVIGNFDGPYPFYDGDNLSD